MPARARPTAAVADSRKAGDVGDIAVAPSVAKMTVLGAIPRTVASRYTGRRTAVAPKA